MAALPPGKPVVPIIFYRALLLAADTAPIDALCAALDGARPGAGAAGRHEPEGRCRGGVSPRRLGAAAAGRDRHDDGVRGRRRAGEPTPLDGPDVPVLQAVIATTRRAAWRDSPRGLGAADLAMHVVLPELDGRVLAGAVAFKDPLPPHEGWPSPRWRAGPSRTASRWSRIASPRWRRLRAMPRASGAIAVLMPDYPGAPGRTGYAVGLDVPASVIGMLEDLAAAGYTIAERTRSNPARTARRTRRRR